MINKKEKAFASTSVLWLLFIPLAAVSKAGIVESLEYLNDDKCELNTDLEHWEK